MLYCAVLDGGPGDYRVVFPDLPGCWAMGKTIDEAMEAASKAAADWASSEVERGCGVPDARPAHVICREPEAVEALAKGAHLVTVRLVRPPRAAEGEAPWPLLRRDRLAWLERQAALLREGKLGEADRDALAEFLLTVVRTGGEGSVVVLPEQEFAGWKETAHLLSNPENARHLLGSLHQLGAGR